MEPRGRPRFAPHHAAAARGGSGGSEGGGPSWLPESVAPVCISLTSSRCRSPPGLPRTTCRSSSRTRREATSPRPPGTPSRRRRDCMVRVAQRGASGGCGTQRRPGTLQEAVRRAGQEAAGRRVRRKLLPPGAPGSAVWARPGAEGRRSSGREDRPPPGPSAQPHAWSPHGRPRAGEMPKAFSTHRSSLACSFLGL